MSPVSAGEREAAAERRWMELALRLARRGLGRTSPNPMVGAVVASRSGRAAGEGWHRGPGKPHAEVLALGQAGDLARAGTLFVNLEPCVHHGRTPPCVEAVIEAGIRIVFCSMLDPDPRVNGAGVEALRRAGIDVHVGLMGAEAKALNRAYVTHRSEHRPYVTYKVAMSLDGRIAAADGSSRWITGEDARRDAHRWRARADGICVGVGTILADDPQLTARAVPASRQPRRAVVASLAKTPLTAKVLQEGAPTVIFVSDRARAGRLTALERAGVEVVVLPSAAGGISLPAILKDLAERGVMDLLLEGGSRLAGSFASAGLIDRYLVYAAPKLLGGAGSRPVIEGWAAESIAAARVLRFSGIRRLGEDIRIEAFPAEPG